MKTPTKSKQVSKVKTMTRLEAANKINKQHQDYESKWVQTLPVPLLSQMKKYKCNVHGYKTLKWVTKSNKFMRVRHQIAQRLIKIYERDLYNHMVAFEKKQKRLENVNKRLN